MATLQEKYDAGKKAYAASLRANRGQAGGSSSIPSAGKKSAFRELQRQKFFGDRKDISTDRIDRRTRQEGNLRQFKDSLVRQGNYVKDSKGNPVRDSKGDYVYTNTYTFDTDSSSPTFGQQVGYGVTDKMQDLALRFGPTFKEIGSDIGYGLGSMAKGAGDLIMSGNFGIMGIAKGLYENFSNKASQAKDFLGNQINKLSDIDLEILKNKDKYKLTSQKPDLQLVNQLEDNAKLMASNRDLFGSYSNFDGSAIPGEVDQVPIPSLVPTTQYGLPQISPGFKVMSQEQRDLLNEIKQADSAPQTNNIQIKNGVATPITDEEFLENQRIVEEDFANDPFFKDKMTKTSNQINQPQYDIVTDYQNQNQEIQNLINESRQNNNAMFNSGVMTPSQTEDIFGIDLQQ